jgi:hypothetical protein
MSVNNRTDGFKLIEHFAPAVLQELQNLFPDAAGRFIGRGQLLGVDVERADAVAALTIARIAYGLCNEAIGKTQSQLRAAHLMTTWSCFLTAASGSALIGTALSPWPQMLKIIVGVLALAGALAGIGGKRFGIGLGGEKLPEESHNLGRLSQELVRVQVKLAVRLATKLNPERYSEMVQLVDKAHAISGDVIALASGLGMKGLDETHIKEIIEEARRDSSFAEVRPMRLCAVDQLMPINAN